MVAKLQLQSQVFGNSSCIIIDKGTAFFSSEFENYCKKQGIKHVMVTTNLPQVNRQVERVKRTIIPVFTKRSMSDPTK